jgi:hypothetical protein
VSRLSEARFARIPPNTAGAPLIRLLCIQAFDYVRGKSGIAQRKNGTPGKYRAVRGVAMNNSPAPIGDTLARQPLETRVNQYKPGGSLGRPSIPAGEDPMMDFRARLVQSQAEAAERRRMDLAEQSSRLKTAEERIRIWERIHEVNLPRDPAHRLVEIIATNTGLTDADVRDEQHRRATLRAAV